MTPAQLRNAADALEALGLETLPDKWLELLKAGWKIQLTSCHCGGDWAWLNPESVMMGCVCHQTPK